MSLSPRATQVVTAGLEMLQNRIAHGLKVTDGWVDHLCFVSLSIADTRGNVLQTIQPGYHTSSTNVMDPGTEGQFAGGHSLMKHTQRIAAVAEAAVYVWGIAEDEGAVVNATFQDKTYKGVMNFVIQFFKGSDGKMVMREVDVPGR